MNGSFYVCGFSSPPGDVFNQGCQPVGQSDLLPLGWFSGDLEVMSTFEGPVCLFLSCGYELPAKGLSVCPYRASTHWRADRGLWE